MEIGTEISQKIRSAIKAKLIELGAYVDDELPDYIMVMVANKRSQQQMTDDLSLFLSTSTEKFTLWLHGLLKKLQSINSDQVQAKPKQKDKHKTEKKKSRPSTSDKTVKTESTGKKEDGKKTKPESKDPGGKAAEKITSTVKTGEESSIITEINISENTDEFNEENKSVETAAPSKPGKQPSSKAVKSAKSTKSTTKSASQDKSKAATAADQETKKSSRKKPTSFVASVKRKYEEEEEDEEYDPLNPAVGSVASVIRGPSRKSSVPKGMQANRSLLMKAVNDAEKSVTTTKRSDVPTTDNSSGMKSDQRPVDLRKRLKTAAGLQLISRTKRKGLDNMTYTVENDVKKAKKSSGDFTEMKYTVKNTQTSKTSEQKKSKTPAVAPSRMAASALQAIIPNPETKTEEEEEVEDEERDTTDSEYDSNDSEISDEMDESEVEGDEEIGSGVEFGAESGEESEAESEEELGSESEYSVEEIEIEVTDRASQTLVNMRESNFRMAGIKSVSCDQQCQTDVKELGGQDLISVKLSKEKLGEIDSCLLNLFIENLLPFDFVENESFKLFTKTLQSKYHFPKRKKLISELGMMYNAVTDDIRKDLSELESCAITHNSWENMAAELHENVSVQFVTNDWDLKQAVIRTSIIDRNNLLDSTTNFLEETRLKWHLQRPIAVVTEADMERSIFEMLDWKTVSCFGSCMKTIVSACLEKAEICHFIQRGRELIESVQENEQVLDVFEKKKLVLLSSQAQTGKFEVDDGGKNWSKTLDMILKLSEQTPALHAAIMDSDLTNQGVDLRSNLYSFNEQSVLESLVKILSPFKTATDIVTTTDGLPTIQKVIPTLIKLEKVLEKDINDSPEIDKVKRLMKEKIQSFLKTNKEFFVLACLVHPQTKQIGFLSQEDRDYAKTLLFKEVKSECEKEFGKSNKKDDSNSKFKKGKKQHQKQTSSMSGKVDDQDTGCADTTTGVDDSSIDVSPEKVSEQTDGWEGNKPSSGGSEEGSNTDDDSTLTTGRETAPINTGKSKAVNKTEETSTRSNTVDNDWLDDVIRAPEEQKSPEEVAKIELDVYMAEPASSKHPLKWWREKHPLYPRISKVARRILAVPASSLSSDDVYSLSPSIQVLDVRVKPEHVDTMMFLHKNRHLLQ